MVHYVTDTALDKDALKGEAAIVIPEIKRLYPGLGENFDFVLLRAYNESPTDPKKTYENYTTVIEMEQGDDP